MYLFYLGDTQFPVAPSKMQIKINNKNKTMTLINEGEINLLKIPGLTDIAFDVLLPNVKYPFAKYPNGFQNASYYLSLLEKIKTSNKPCTFRVIRQRDNGKSVGSTMSMSVSLEGYTITEDVKNGVDIVVSVNLKQYKTYATKTFTIVKKVETPEATVTQNRETTKEPERTYTIKQGDNLWKIARQQLGNELRWKEIYDKNVDVIEAAARKYGKASSSTGHWIYPGVVLILP